MIPRLHTLLYPGHLEDCQTSDMPEDPYAYVVAAFQAPPSPDYVPGPELVPDQIMRRTVRMRDDEDPEEDHADYPADVGEDGNDEDESSDDDEDDDVDIEGAVDHDPYAEETEPFKTDESAATPPPHPAYWVTARISIRDEPPTLFWSDTEIPLPPLPVSPPPPASPTYPFGISSCNDSAKSRGPIYFLFTTTTYHTLSYHDNHPPSGTPPLLPIPLPTSSPSLLLPSAGHGADRLEADNGLLPHGSGEIIKDLIEDVGYEITRHMDENWQDIDDIYTRLDDEQTKRQLMTGRLNMLYRDSCAHSSLAGNDYRVAGSGPQEIGVDYRVVGSGPQETGTVH
ncbi:hypothetical protein Tco_0799510 [Tanacetum coccineum]|uniref:Uncharacterized protein n=1 Tax=Tanacetum coccineum TaxID=301880 RepID=A0ABQ4ZTS6_9ASTR